MKPDADPLALLLDALADRILARMTTASSDELVAFPFGVEERAARKLVRDGALPAARIGRRLYVKRSDLLALVERLATVRVTGDVGADYLKVATEAHARAGRTRGRRVGS